MEATAACALLVLIGVWLFMRGAIPLARVWAVKRWAPVHAELEMAEVHSERVPSVRAYLTYSFPVVSYRYRVREKEYVSSRVGIEQKAFYSSFCDVARNAVERIREERMAYYNPKKENEAVLLRELPWGRLARHLGMVLWGMSLIVVVIIAGRC